MKTHELKPVIVVGKLGLSDSHIFQIKEMMKKHRMIKIRILKTAGDRKEIADKILAKTGKKKISLVGYVLTISR